MPVQESTADAVVLIGDRAMKVSDGDFHTVIDLAEAWQAFTGLPFVFALWVVRPGVDLGALPEALPAEPGGGPGGCRALAAAHGPGLGLDVATCYDYLTRVLSYELGEPEIAGLSRFARMAAALGLAPEGVDLVFHRRRDLARSRLEGRRLSPDEGVELLQSPTSSASAAPPTLVCKRLHPERYRTYNIDRNINYTNVCTAVCDFCAFYRKVDDTEAYVLDRPVLLEKIRETVALGGDQILMQGGLHPDLPLEWYEELLHDIKAHFPQVNVHGFSPPEIHHFTKVAKLPLRTVLERLKEAGLGSLPGGGGEILVDRVRKAMTRGKVMTDDWLNVHRVWHELGGRRPRR